MLPNHLCAAWEIIAYWGFNLLTYEIFGVCPDIHISSFSPSHQDLDHMKTNRTADIRIQEAKNKNSEHFSQCLSCRPRFLCKGRIMVYWAAPFRIERYCVFLCIGFFTTNGRKKWLRRSGLIISCIHFLYFFNFYTFVYQDKW